MQEIDHFLQGFLCLILPGHILEGHAGLLLHIHLGIALSDAHHAASLCHPFHDIKQQKRRQSQGQKDGHKQLEEHLPHRIRDLALKFHSGVIEFLRQRIVIDISRIIIRRFLCIIILVFPALALLLVLELAEELILELSHHPLDPAVLLLFLRPFLRLLDPCLIGKDDVDAAAAQPDFLYLFIVDQLQEFIITDLLRTCAAHQRIKSQYHKSDQQGCNEDDPPALPVIFRIILIILVIHSFPPKISYYHYKYRFCINQ